MKKNQFICTVLFSLSFALFPQETLKSIEEEYYDFLSLQGITERPYLNYRTLSDSEWNIKEEENSSQFDVSDQRTLDEVVNWLMKMDYIPSFCTACYREGRTGDRFMSLVKSGQIANCCLPNALMTLKEYLEDYASPITKENGEKVIATEIKKIPNEKVRKIVLEHLSELNDGKRDFRF